MIINVLFFNCLALLALLLFSLSSCLIRYFEGLNLAKDCCNVLGPGAMQGSVYDMDS